LSRTLRGRRMVRRHGPGGGRYGRRGAVPTPVRCADPHGGRDHARTVVWRSTPTGAGAGHPRRVSRHDPHGGRDLPYASLGARPHRTGGRRGLEEDYSWASSAWRPFRQNFSLGMSPFTQRARDLRLLPALLPSFSSESRIQIDVPSARRRRRVGGECSAASGDSSASRGNSAEPGAAPRARGSTLRY
jgi:hypothetical protein